MEVWDAYRQDRSLAGQDLVRGQSIPHGLYHLVCSVLVQHTDGNYLVMQRDPKKPLHPGMWEATAGGSAIKGEDPLTCIQRELWEETGIRMKTEDFHLVSSCTSPEKHSIHDFFVCVTDCNKETVRCQQGETVAYRWLTPAEFAAFFHSGKMIQQHRIHYQDYLQKHCGL